MWGAVGTGTHQKCAGRMSLAKLLVIIPAHFLGTIFGAVIIHTIHPPYASLVCDDLRFSVNVVLTVWFMCM
jgi:hypothetical protein